MQSNIRASVAHHSLLSYLRSIGISITRHEAQGSPSVRTRVARLRRCSAPIAAVLVKYTPWRTALKCRKHAEAHAASKQLRVLAAAKASAAYAAVAAVLVLVLVLVPL